MDNNHQSAGEAGMRKLITNFRNHPISVDEHARINEWLQASDRNELLFEEWIRERPGDARAWAEIMNSTDPVQTPEHPMETGSKPVIARPMSLPGRKEDEKRSIKQDEHSGSDLHWKLTLLVLLALLVVLIMLIVLFNR